MHAGTNNLRKDWEKRRARTHCKNGHEYTPENTAFKGYRVCKICARNDLKRLRKKRKENGDYPQLTREQAERVISSIRDDGRTISHITAGTAGHENKYVPGLYVCERGSLDRFCKENPKIARIILPLAKKNAAVLMGWRTRTVAAPALLRNNGADAYEAIMSATQNLPLEIRSDVQGDMFIAVAEGRLKIADIQDRVREFRNAHNRADRQSVFNPWGHLSLEKPLSEDGSLTLKDVLRDDQRLWS